MAVQIVWFDSNGLYFFETVEYKVYANNPQTIAELRTKITRVIRGIEVTLLESVIEISGKRIKSCQQSRDGHLHDIHFHT